MQPDFSKKTIESLAKRASFKCSNPDCRINTVGPNSESQKSTLIGEAAHIFGARLSAKRYCADMTDTARAEITNAIWLCRNCHKLIDTDDKKYTSNILFTWREEHEAYISSVLGSNSEKIQYEKQLTKLSKFIEYPPLIRRIIIDKPDGWEWSLTAELMRFLNTPYFRSLNDLHDGLYIKHQKHLDEEDIINWVSNRLTEAQNLTPTICNLIERLNDTWGPPGESGNVDEIHHMTCLIRDFLEQIVKYEEEIYFTNVPDDYQSLIELNKDLLGSQAKKLKEIPEALDEVVSLIDTEHEGTKEKPLIMQKTISFDVPTGWEKNFNRELKKIEKKQGKNESNGCLSIFVGVIIVLIIFSYL